jgi:hypothetical protein
VTSRLYPTMVRFHGAVYAIEYDSDRFGTLNATGDVFTPIGTTTLSCCDYGLASDGKTMWVVARDGSASAIRTIDPVTGELGTSVPLSPNTSITDLRWFEGAIYATTASGYLSTAWSPRGRTSAIRMRSKYSSSYDANSWRLRPPCFAAYSA